MSVVERFVEIPVIGALLLLPIVPWLYAAKAGTPQVLASILSWSRSRRAILALAVVFVLGVVGNQLIDIPVEGVAFVSPKDEYEAEYCPAPDSPPTLEGAEHVIATRSEYAREYFDRHRMFSRIDRAAATGMFLLLLSVVAYQLRVKRRVPFFVHMLIVITVSAFGWAYYTETESLWRMVIKLEQAGLASPLPDK
jgi:hypothetical protein